MSTKRSEAENKSLKEKIEVLQSKMEVQQSEINSLNKELSETKARANKLETDLSDQSKIMNVVKMANEALKPGMRQLQQDFLDQDVQDSHVRNLESNNIAIDYNLFKNLENLEDFTNYPDPLWSETIGCSFGRGTSIAEAKLSPLHETVNVEGFRILKENSPMIQEIFREYPNIASGLQVCYLASRNGLMNSLAEDLVAQSWEEVEVKEEIKSTKAKLKLLE
ncbi:Uncharacterized protein TCM_002014 [Theobroma cacao]|uniref:Uncharacterized protein n=1 Tax=Theobroma cacao TaxID=3641 RepID=A0A061DL94_THECC|nr:Uncharacterized protein TCM_002014 [Theobroma cacao]